MNIASSFPSSVSCPSLAPDIALLQVVLPAFQAFHQNGRAFRIFALLDEFSALAAEVKVIDPD